MCPGDGPCPSPSSIQVPKMKKLTLLALSLMGSIVTVLGQTTINPRHLKPIIGSWTGTLTYLDYTSGKPFSMPADLTIAPAQDRNQFQCSNAFPQEAEANWTDTLVLSPDRKILDGEAIQSKRRNPDGNLEIITEGDGLDGNDQKPARFRHTYIIGKEVFLKRKEVRFAGDDKWIMRHEYKYTKATPAPQNQ